MATAALKGDKTVSELAQQSHVHANQITQWKTQLQEQSALAFGGDAQDHPPVDLKALHAKLLS